MNPSPPLPSYYIMSKQDILARFVSHVKSVPICVDTQNSRHNGKEGHWLEERMGIIHNSKNEADLYGFELKTGQRVTTFMDKAPDHFYIDGESFSIRDKTKKSTFFDRYASKKKSDEPTIGGWSVTHYNLAGQIMEIDVTHSIVIRYDYEQDQRSHKSELSVSKTPHIIMKWEGSSLRKAIESKFNQKGFFTFKKEGNAFTRMFFGAPFTFDTWIAECKKGVIYHDGYSRVNGRGRHVFRASNTFWDTLVTEEIL